MVLNIIFTIFVVYVTWRLIKFYKYASVINKIPGPPFKFMPSISKNERPELFVDWAKQYGPIFKIWVGPAPIIVLSDIDDVRTVLHSDESKYKILQRNVLRGFLGEGLVISTGEMWQKHRKLLNPAFNISTLRKMVPMMVEVGENLVERWEKLAETDVADLKNDLKLATLDIIGRSAFGTKFDSLSGKEIPLIKSLQIFPKAPMVYIYLSEVFPILAKLPFSFNINFKKNIAIIRSSLKDVIDTRKEERFQQSNERDLLGLLLNANEGGAELSEKEIGDEATTFLFAGHDTTAALLMWFCYELALHPEEMKKLQAEVDAVLEGGLPTAENLSKLKYLGHALNETFRLHPPVPLLGRRATADDNIRGYLIPKGAQLSVAAYSVHLNENLWRNPREFQPSRWEELNSEESKAFLPFSTGPRSCIGRNFSLLEAKTLASMVLQKYEFRLAENQNIQPTIFIILTPSTLKMHIIKRKK